MIRIGRRIHARITTWVLNKTTRTFLTAGFVVIVFLYTGKFAVATFHMVISLSLSLSVCVWIWICYHRS
jgi:H+-transporting ATPase